MFNKFKDFEENNYKYLSGFFSDKGFSSYISRKMNDESIINILSKYRLYLLQFVLIYDEILKKWTDDKILDMTDNSTDKKVVDSVVYILVKESLEKGIFFIKLFNLVSKKLNNFKDKQFYNNNIFYFNNKQKIDRFVNVYFTNALSLHVQNSAYFIKHKEEDAEKSSYIFDIANKLCINNPEIGSDFENFLFIKKILSKYYHELLREDYIKFYKYFSIYFEYRDRIKNYKKVEARISDFHELQDLVNKQIVSKNEDKSGFESVKKAEEFLEKGVDYDIISQASNVIIYAAKTPKAACVLGENSDWCTATMTANNEPTKSATSNFYHYANEGGGLGYLIIFNFKGNELYQMSINDEYIWFMDIYDREKSINKVFRKLSNVNIFLLLRYTNFNEELISALNLENLKEVLFFKGGKEIRNAVKRLALNEYKSNFFPNIKNFFSLKDINILINDIELLLSIYKKDIIYFFEDYLFDLIKDKNNLKKIIILLEQRFNEIKESGSEIAIKYERFFMLCIEESKALLI